jgi:hypothetical protein
VHLDALVKLFPALAPFLALLPLSCASVGCALQEKALSDHFTMVTESVVIPLVDKAVNENTARNYQMSVSAHATNPTYKVTFRGVMGTCVEGEATLGIEGIAGQGQFASQGDAGQAATVVPPVDHE